MKVLIAAAAALTLAACIPERPRIPTSLLSCLDEPPPPSKPRTQASVATYNVDTAEAGRDCRSKLGQVRGIVGASQ